MAAVENLGIRARATEPAAAPLTSLDLLSSKGMVVGGNIVPKPAHAGSFKALFAEWDWTGWVKFQVDLARSAGCNTVRLVGDVAGVNDATFTQAYYLACWRQLINYCAGLGMKVYVCGGGQSQFGALSVAQIQAVLVALGGEINGDAAVIGYDIIQEANAWAALNGATVAAAVDAVCDRLLTFSHVVFSYAQVNDKSIRDSIRAFVDFFDYHLYYDPGVHDMVSGYWRSESKPLLFDEFGKVLSDGQSAQTTHYNAVAALTASMEHTGNHAAGACVWAITDQDTASSGKWGIYDGTGTARSYLTAIVATLPTSHA